MTIYPVIRDSAWVSDTAGCVPHAISILGKFENVSEYSWDFGDGFTSNKAYPKHTYNAPGDYLIKLQMKSYTGCTLNRSFKVKVTGPAVAFDLDPVTGCTPLTVRMIDKSPPGPVPQVKMWVMGDGASYMVVNDTMYHTYKLAPVGGDSHLVSLKIEDSLGCRGMSSRLVYPSGPQASFYGVPKDGCSTVSYQFIPLNELSTDLLKFKWLFDDETTSSAQKPVKEYKTYGEHVTRLQVTDIRTGCTGEITDTFIVRRETSNLSFEPSATDAACPPLFVSFKNTSAPGTSEVLKWEWNFGDGSFSELEHPQKLFTSAGSYSISLNATYKNGCIDYIHFPDMITVGGPQAAYTIDTTTGCLPFTVNFKATSNNTIAFSWDLGNGTVIKGRNITYTYEQPGDYPPSLILSDGINCTYALPLRDTIRVRAYPQPDFIYSNTCRGYPTHFNDTSPDTDRLVAWEWDFGDGTKDSGRAASHIYKNTGIHDVALTVTNDVGCVVSTSRKIRIGGMRVDFRADPEYGCVGTPIHFRDLTDADTLISSWRWDFGDGKTSDARDPEHLYEKKGIFTISLIVVDYKGCTDTIIKNAFITIGDTIAPQKVNLHHVTVTDDYSVGLTFRKSTELDFRQYLIYRKNMTGTFELIDSLSDPDDTLYTDKGLNTLRNAYTYV
ncbi:MAG: PKD domain-containing protein, partial [Bacteroidota bacterium]|nr:PKD domain-containing protein [Bacteroidota bacterium]